MRYSKKYPDDMVENLAESPGMCSDGPGSARIKIPKEGAFSLRERARKRGRGSVLAVWERERRATGLSPRVLGPTCVRHSRTVRGALVDGPRGARTVRNPGADGPLFAPERPVLPLFPMSRADGPHRPGGRSTRSGRTVRPTAANSPTFLYIFSLIYSEIKI
jgi:hypothetical protein